MKKNLLKTIFLGASIAFSFNLISCADASDDDTADEKAGSKFASIIGGTVTGSEAYKSSDDDYIFVEGRTITIGNLIVSTHEVTQKEFQRYCFFSNQTIEIAETCGSNTIGAEIETEPSEKYGLGDDFPAYGVSWYDAIAYCNLRSIAEGLTPVYKVGGKTGLCCWEGALTKTEGTSIKYAGPAETNALWDSVEMNGTANGYRLPTEAEWEYIARCGDNGLPDKLTDYAGSDEIDTVSWYDENSEEKVHPVNTKAPNCHGIYNLSGNVSEWVWDWYGAVSSETAATGNSSGKSRVLRGGSAISPLKCSSVSYRDASKPYNRMRTKCSLACTGCVYALTGFRVVRNAD